MGTLRRSKQRTDAFLLATEACRLSLKFQREFKESLFADYIIHMLQSGLVALRRAEDTGHTGIQ
jgi:hypothetical protein